MKRSRWKVGFTEIHPRAQGSKLGEKHLLKVWNLKVRRVGRNGQKKVRRVWRSSITMGRLEYLFSSGCSNRKNEKKENEKKKKRGPDEPEGNWEKKRESIAKGMRERRALRQHSQRQFAARPAPQTTVLLSVSHFLPLFFLSVHSTSFVFKKNLDDSRVMGST